MPDWKDYLKGNAPKGLDAKTTNDNFVHLLCRIQALIDVIGLSPEQRAKLEEIEQNYVIEAISTMNQARKSG